MKRKSRKPSNGRTVDVTAVCMEPELTEAAKERAKKQRRSFSAYVAMLIERDLAEDSEKAVA